MADVVSHHLHEGFPAVRYAAPLCLFLASCTAPVSSPQVVTIPPAPTEVWLDTAESATVNGVTVRVIGVAVGRVKVETFGGVTETENDNLVVTVRLTNTDPTAKPEYRSWGLRPFEVSPKAALTDGRGNIYKPVRFPASAKIVGSVERSASLYPERPVEDVLVFERPLAAATELRLELPAANVGGPGVIRFRITPPR